MAFSLGLALRAALQGFTPSLYESRPCRAAVAKSVKMICHVAFYLLTYYVFAI